MLTIELLRWDALGRPFASPVRQRIDIPPAATSLVWRGPIASVPFATECTRTTCFIRLRFSPEARTSSRIPTATPPPIDAPADAYVWLSTFREAALPSSRVDIVEVLRPEGSTTRASVTLKSNATAAFVAVDSSAVAGAFDDGAILLAASEERTLSFVAKRPFETAAFQAGLRVRSLRDTY